MQSASRRVKNRTSDSERLRTFLERQQPLPVGSLLALTSAQICLYASVRRRFTFGAIGVSRIFISHSSTNNAEAVALRDWLAANGWEDEIFLDLESRSAVLQPVNAGSVRSIRRQTAVRRYCS